MYFFICIACPALELFQMTCTCIHERELVEVTFSVLRFHLVEVHAACVDTYRSSGLHSSVSNPMAGDRFGQLIGSRFGHSSTRQLVAAYVHQSVEESSRSQYDALCFESNSPDGDESCYLSVFNEKFAYGILPNMKVGGVFQSLAP